MKGIDYAWARPSPSQLKSLGYEFVMRYLSWLPNTKVLSASERDLILGAGLNLGLNWEFDAGDSKRGSAGGSTDSLEATRQAKLLKYPAGKTIYYSIGDYDVLGQGYLNQAVAYASAARKITHDAGYRMGAYGGFHLLAELWSRGLIDDGWQSPSTFGRPGWYWDNRNAIHQTALEVTVLNSDTDINYTVNPVYLWNSPSTPTTPITPEVDLDTNQAAKLDAIYNLADVAKLDTGKDGVADQDFVVPITKFLKALDAKVAQLDAKVSTPPKATVTVDPAVLAQALQDPALLAAIAKAVNDDAARRGAE